MASSLVSQASSCAAALLGLAKGPEDEEDSWTEGLGLIGEAQMGTGVERVLPFVAKRDPCGLSGKNVVQGSIPKLFAHLGQQGVDLPTIGFSWFLSLMLNCIPVERSKSLRKLKI